MHKFKVFLFFDEGRGEQVLLGPPFEIVITDSELEGLDDEVVAMILGGGVCIYSTLKPLRKIQNCAEGV